MTDREPPGHRRLWLYITVDRTRGVALLRGVEARRVARLVTGDPTWSRSGRGWVIPADRVDDVCAYGQHLHEIVVVNERRPS